MLVYVGTFTGGVHGSDAKGISVFDLDQKTGKLSHLQTLEGLQSPSFLALHPTLPYIYAVERYWSDGDHSSGVVSTFALDSKTGALSAAGRQRSGGEYPAHIEIHPDARFVFAVNPLSGTVAVLPIDESGVVGPVVECIRHEGHGAKPHTDPPYPHSAWVDPSGGRLLCCDRNLDRVTVWDFDRKTGSLTPAPYPTAQVSSGAGPRHLAFHPNSSIVYVLNETDSTISVFSYEAETGALSILQTVPTIPREFKARNVTAQILVHASGRFVFCSNRGHNSIARFAIDPSDGRLTFLGHESTRGETPRNFNIDPSGELMLVGNQDSGTIEGFWIDSSNGDLRHSGESIKTLSPVCILFHPQQAAGR
jgi:6-phosphogluconolactonase